LKGADFADVDAAAPMEENGRLVITVVVRYF
jgi:hypothetical protein